MVGIQKRTSSHRLSMTGQMPSLIKINYANGIILSRAAQTKSAHTATQPIGPTRPPGDAWRYKRLRSARGKSNSSRKNTHNPASTNAVQ